MSLLTDYEWQKYITYKTEKEALDSALETERRRIHGNQSRNLNYYTLYKGAWNPPMNKAGEWEDIQTKYFTDLNKLKERYNYTWEIEQNGDTISNIFEMHILGKKSYDALPPSLQAYFKLKEGVGQTLIYEKIQGGGIRKRRTRVRNTRNTRKISKRVLQMWNDPDTVWGKNPELEHFWGELASGKKAVIIYKDKPHKYVGLPNRTTKKYKSILNEFEEDTAIVAVLSSNPSQDAYEQYLYPKAKSKSVEYVIKHYDTFFKPIVKGDKLRVPL